MSNRKLDRSAEPRYKFLHNALRGAGEKASRCDSNDEGYSLAIAVLCRAILDLDILIYHTTASSMNERPIDRAQAYIFCFSTHGEWARSRRDWCDLAGISDGAFNKVARAYMALVRSRFGVLTDEHFHEIADKNDKIVAKDNSNVIKAALHRRGQRKDALPETPEFTL